MRDLRRGDADLAQLQAGMPELSVDREELR
jgi:hypothetical protein